MSTEAYRQYRQQCGDPFGRKKLEQFHRDLLELESRREKVCVLRRPVAKIRLGENGELAASYLSPISQQNLSLSIFLKHSILFYETALL